MQGIQDIQAFNKAADHHIHVKIIHHKAKNNEQNKHKYVRRICQLFKRAHPLPQKQESEHI